MKKNILFLALASVMLGFVGCATDDTDEGVVTPAPQGNAPEILVARISDEATRTMLTPNGKSAFWSAGDQIAVFADATTTEDKSDYVIYNLKSGVGTDDGVFEKIAGQNGNFKPVRNGLPDPDMCVAIAPYYKAEGAEKSNMYYNMQSYYKRDRLGIILPKEQIYMPGSYDPRAMGVMAIFATPTSNDIKPELSFKYMNSLVRMTLTAKEALTLSKIELQASGMPVVGRVSFDFNPKNKFSDSEPLNVEMMDVNKEPYGSEANNSIFLCGDIALNATPKDVYFGILPHKQGYGAQKYTVIFYMQDGSSYSKVCVAPAIVQPGTVVVIPPVCVERPQNVPVLTKNDTQISWTPESEFRYAVHIMSGTTLVKKMLTGSATSYSFEKDINPVLAAILDNVKYIPGSKYTFTLQLVATSKSGDVVSLGSNIVSYDYTFAVPDLDIAQTEDAKYAPIFEVKNFAMFSPLEYAYVAKKDAVLADFDTATFVPLTATDRGKFDSSKINEGRGFDLDTDYTVLFRGTSGGQVKTKFIAVYVEKQLIVSVNPFTYNIEVANIELFEGLKESDITINVLEGNDTMTDLTKAIKTTYVKGKEISYYRGKFKSCTFKATAVLNGVTIESKPFFFMDRG
ncbi:MAG: hypothetical protein RR996_02225 [Alistipes sp.]